MKPKINIVWLKRDLRLRDHEPLKHAAEEGLPILLCYFFEPSLMADERNTTRHWRFINESLKDLQKQLERFPLKLHVFHSEVVKSFELIRAEFEINKILSHQETGMLLTFERDLAVQNFCKKHHITWQEYRQDAVFRRLKSRENWEEKFAKHIAAPISQPDLVNTQSVEISSELKGKLEGKSLPKEFSIPNKLFQPGGETYGWRYLNSFVHERAENYARHLSKPALSRKSCSRLSPYIAFGCLSVRQIFQLCHQEQGNKSYGYVFDSFLSRVWWRSHYLQKLESEYQIEFEPINKGFLSFDYATDEHFEAWATGNTGIPMVDASMRSLEATGFLNFRMRAMLITFATFALRIGWKEIATHLAKLFLDFEPGIHYPQIQMQAGLTGYHPLRIFNPIVQSQQHDKDGDFVKRWVPELAKLPANLLPEPHKITAMEQGFYNFEAGKDYLLPIVDYDQAVRKNKDLYWAHRNKPEVVSDLPRVWSIHCAPQNIVVYKKQLETQGVLHLLED